MERTRMKRMSGWLYGVTGHNFLTWQRHNKTDQRIEPAELVTSKCNAAWLVAQLDRSGDAKERVGGTPEMPRRGWAGQRNKQQSDVSFGVLTTKTSKECRWIASFGESRSSSERFAPRCSLESYSTFIRALVSSAVPRAVWVSATVRRPSHD
jgi:hypothetical protein